jgi:hypothetical protein
MRKDGSRPTEGRPTKYSPSMITMLDAQASFPGGATITEIAEIIRAGYRQVYEWMAAHEEFSQAVARARGRADKKVEKSIFAAAVGYEHPEDKIFLGRDGKPVVVKTTKHYPPDSALAKFWLINRSRKAAPDEKWTDNQVKEITGANGDPLTVQIVRFAEDKK